MFVQIKRGKEKGRWERDKVIKNRKGDNKREREKGGRETGEGKGYLGTRELKVSRSWQIPEASLAARPISGPLM